MATTTTDTIWKDLLATITDHIGLNNDDIHETSNFIEDLGLDTLDEVELIMEVEERFDISIDEDEAERCTTVGSLYNLIKSKKENKNEH